MDKEASASEENVGTISPSTCSPYLIPGQPSNSPLVVARRDAFPSPPVPPVQPEASGCRTELVPGRVYSVRIVVRATDSSAGNRSCGSQGKRGKSHPCILIHLCPDGETCWVCPVTSFNGRTIRQVAENEVLRRMSRRDGTTIPDVQSIEEEIKRIWLPLAPLPPLIPDLSHRPITVEPPLPKEKSYVHLSHQVIKCTYVIPWDEKTDVKYEDFRRLLHLVHQQVGEAFQRTLESRGGSGSPGGGGGSGSPGGGGGSGSPGGGGGSGSPGGGGGRKSESRGAEPRFGRHGGGRMGERDGGGGWSGSGSIEEGSGSDSGSLEEGNGRHSGEGRGSRGGVVHEERKIKQADEGGEIKSVRGSDLTDKSKNQQHSGHQHNEDNEDEDDYDEGEDEVDLAALHFGHLVEFSEDLEDVDWSWDGHGEWLTCEVEGESSESEEVSSVDMLSLPIKKGEIDLRDSIKWDSVECLNQNRNHPYTNALFQKRWDNGDLYLESDVDDQLILYIPFEKNIKPLSLIIRGPLHEGPKTVKIFANKDTYDFDELQQTLPTCELVLTKENLEGNQPVLLNRAKFWNVTSLTLFIVDNQSRMSNQSGSSEVTTTKLQKLAIIGCTAENMPMEEFKPTCPHDTDESTCPHDTDELMAQNDENAWRSRR